MKHTLNVTTLLIGICAELLSATAAAQQYPVRPIRMVVGFAAGGATDLSARFPAQKVSESIGQQVIVGPAASTNSVAISMRKS